MLRTTQQDLIKKILHLNEDIPNGRVLSALKWKVLIYDDRGLEILTTLMKVSSLHQLGVTITSKIMDKRSPVQDVSAVYFIEPTNLNLERLSADINDNMYSSYYINIISHIEDASLKKFAEDVAIGPNARKVKFIYDQYIDFSSPDPNLFTLFEDDTSLINLYGFHTTESDFNSYVSRISANLASVFVTFGEIPKVFYQSGEGKASKFIMKAFSQELEKLVDKPGLWRNRQAKGRGGSSWLILVDRMSDLASNLHHPCTYQALIHDNFGINRNSVQLGKEKIDLDCDIDSFWLENRTKAYDSVAKESSTQFNSFKKEISSIQDNMEGAISRMQEMSRKNEALSKHTKLCTEILSLLTTEKTADLFKIEEDLFTKRSFDFDKFLNLLKTIPNEEDRERSVIIAYLCDAISDDQFPALETAVGKNMDYLRLFSSQKILSRKDGGLFGKLLKGVPSGDPSAVAEHLPIVEKVRSLIENNSSEFESKTLFRSDSSSGDIPSNIFVFVVGPGNYVEYSGLMSIAAKRGLNITYGCTSIPTPQKYLEQFRSLTQ